jgi:hypothetical protein
LNDSAELLRANAAFYDAFASNDIESMDELWARGVDVVCIHPGWPPLYGRAEIMESWRSILLGAETPDILCDDPRATRIAEAGLVTCYEQIGDQTLVASNAFVLQDGVWQLVHHQASPVSTEVPDEPGRTLN